MLKNVICLDTRRSLLLRIIQSGFVLFLVVGSIEGCQVKKSNKWVSYHYPPDVTISGITVDSQGRGWAAVQDWSDGGRSNYIIKPLNCDQCSDIRLPTPPLPSLTRYYIEDMVFDQKDRLWVISDSDSLVFMFGSDSEWHSFPTNTENRAWVISWDSIVIDGQGRAWVSALAEDVYMINPDTGVMTQERLGIVEDLAVDGKGHVWLIQSGVLKVLEDDGWKKVAERGWGKVDSKDRITQLAISAQGDVWTRSKNGFGLWKTDGTWQDYPRNEIMGVFGHDFVVDKDNRVWTGSQYGLWRLDSETGWKGYQVTDSGVIEIDSVPYLNPVDHLALDRDGRLWMSVEEVDSETNLIGNMISVVDVDTMP